MGETRGILEANSTMNCVQKNIVSGYTSLFILEDGFYEVTYQANSQNTNSGGEINIYVNGNNQGLITGMSASASFRHSFYGHWKWWLKRNDRISMVLTTGGVLGGSNSHPHTLRITKIK